MFCQVCGSWNAEEEEHCRKCHQKLLVVSGAGGEEDAVLEEEPDDEGFSFDEHLLERISILEEAVKHTAETVRQLLLAVNKQERGILMNQTGLLTIRELLEEKRVLHREEWSDRWESRLDYQLLALEKRERFAGRKGRIAALYRGKKRKLFNELLGEAEYALFAFEVERALAALESAYRLDTDNHELAWFLGETYFNEGQGARALPYFDRLLQSDPDHYQALVYAGVIHHERGDTRRAESLLRRAVELHPEDFLSNFSLGAVYAGQGRLNRAVALLEKAVAADPVTQAQFLLGSCLYEMGRLGGAIQALKEVVRQDPAYEEAYHLLGLAFLDRHWHRKALDAFRQAQRLNPTKIRYQDLVRYLTGQADSPLPQVGSEAGECLERAEQLLAGDQTEAALGAYREALTSEPDNPTLLMSYAMACLQANRSRETEAVTRRILDLDPGEMLKATAYATLMEALRSEGRYREGNRVGELLLEEGTSNYARTIAYYEMAYNLAEMEEDLDLALDYARQSLDLSPEELRQFPLAAIGWVHYKRREFEPAVDFLSRSSQAGASATTLTHLGMAHLAAGNEGEARRALAEARKLGAGGISLEQRMMECLKDSHRLLEQVRDRRGH